MRPLAPVVLLASCLTLTLGCGSDAAGPSPLVGGIAAAIPKLIVAADTGRVTVAALDSAGDTLRGAPVTLLNTTPDVALLLPDGRFIGRRPGLLVLRAVSGQVETEIHTTVVDSACGRVAAVPGWTGSLGFAYRADYHHHPPTIANDSFDLHVNERLSFAGATLSGPLLIDSETVYWYGVPSTVTAAIQDADTLHRAGGDSVYTEVASAAAPADSNPVTLVADLGYCAYRVYTEFKAVAATSGPGVASDTARLGPIIQAAGLFGAGGTAASGPDSLSLAVMTNYGAATEPLHGTVEFMGLPWALTQSIPGFESPFPEVIAQGEVYDTLAFGTGKAVWSFTPTAAGAAPRALSPVRPRFVIPPRR